MTKKSVSGEPADDAGARLREMILQSLEDVGGEDYLRNHGTTISSLLTGASARLGSSLRIVGCERPPGAVSRKVGQETPAVAARRCGPWRKLRSCTSGSYRLRGSVC